MKPRALHNSFFVIPAHTLKGTSVNDKILGFLLLCKRLRVVAGMTILLILCSFAKHATSLAQACMTKKSSFAKHATSLNSAGLLCSLKVRL